MTTFRSKAGTDVAAPRLFERAFVLVPLAEIVPDRLIAGRRVAAALAQLSAEGGYPIERTALKDCPKADQKQPFGLAVARGNFRTTARTAAGSDLPNDIRD
jgi:hypothetical protein